MRKLARNLAIVVALAAAGSGLAKKAEAGTIGFSTLSSDETPASILDARAQWDVLSPTQVRLTLYNDTDTPEDFRLGAYGFNTTADVSSLTFLSGPAGYTTVSLDTNGHNSPFGRFEYFLDTGRPGTSGPVGVPEGQIAQYLFGYTGTNVDQTDFITELSTNPPGNTNAAGVIHFQGNQDSAYGAGGVTPIPEPMTTALTGAGLAGLGLYARRRRSA